MPKAGRVDRILSDVLSDVSRSQVARWIAEGRVLLRDVAVRPSQLVAIGDLLDVDVPLAQEPHQLEPAAIPLDVIFEDPEVIVVNKPRGLATHPAPTLREATLVNALLHRGGQLSQGSAAYRPGIIHRLDKQTTGLLLIAKNDVAHRKLADQIASRTLKRTYLAIVAGEVEQLADRGRFTISAPIGRDSRNRQRMSIDPKGKSAVTHVVLLGRVNAGAVLRCELETGRTHQIRVHLRSVGLPVLGDPVYAPKEYQTCELQLHAFALEFIHPGSGQPMTLCAPLPSDFLADQGVVDQWLGKQRTSLEPG